MDTSCKKSQVDKQLETSTSYDIFKRIIDEMKGRTFHHHAHILYDIRTLLGDEKKTYLEIGSYCGASASLVIQHPFSTHVCCIDPLNLPHSHYCEKDSQRKVLEDNLERFKGENSFELFQAYSNDPTLIKQITDRDIEIDLLFIDGDHSRRGVLNDFYIYHSFVKSGGFIVFDDYLDKYSSPQVRIAVDEIVNDITKNNLPYEVIGSLRNYQNAFFGTSVSSDFLNEFILYKK